MIEARSMRSEEVSLATCSLRSHFLRFRSEQKAHSDRAHTPLSSLALLVSECGLRYRRVFMQSGYEETRRNNFFW
jgi:hypothetical protein